MDKIVKYEKNGSNETKIGQNWKVRKNCKKKKPEKKFKQQKQTYCKLMMSLSKS